MVVYRSHTVVAAAMAATAVRTPAFLPEVASTIVVFVYEIGAVPRLQASILGNVAQAVVVRVDEFVAVPFVRSPLHEVVSTVGVAIFVEEASVLVELRPVGVPVVTDAVVVGIQETGPMPGTTAVLREIADRVTVLVYEVVIGTSICPSG